MFMKLSRPSRASKRRADGSIKNRKSHRKSKTGCSECRGRHKKCDETRPKCVNCVTAELECSYLNDGIASPNTTPPSGHASPALALTAAGRTGEGNEVVHQSTTVTQDHRLPPVNMVHMELLLRFTLSTYKDFHWEHDHCDLYRHALVKYSLAFPFLMKETLAIAALDLSVNKPDGRFYKEQSIILQNQAVSDFFGTFEDEKGPDGWVAAFIFSFLMGRHMFCHTFAYRDENFDIFLGELVRCINLLRGIRAIIDGHWDAIRQSELKPSIDAGQLLHENATEKGMTTDFDKLRTLAYSVKFEDPVLKGFEDAVHQLQVVYNAERHQQQESSRISLPASLIFAWPITLSSEFTSLLAEKNEEALVVLTYYAALLVHHRNYWLIGDAGQVLLGLLDAYLGEAWKDYLEWPKRYVASILQEG